MHRAPGIPCALYSQGANGSCKTRAHPRRENAEACPWLFENQIGDFGLREHDRCVGAAFSVPSPLVGGGLGRGGGIGTCVGDPSPPTRSDASASRPHRGGSSPPLPRRRYLNWRRLLESTQSVRPHSGLTKTSVSPPLPPSSDTPDAPRSCSPGDAMTHRWRGQWRPAPASASPPSRGGPAPIDPAPECNSAPAPASARLLATLQPLRAA